MAGGETVERAVRWERARQRHESAVSDAGIVPGRAGRRLKYACLTPAGAGPWLLAIAAGAAYLTWTGVRDYLDGAAALRAVLLTVAVGVLSTNRASVSEAGLSFDVAGVRRPSIFGFVPLYAVQDVVPGPRPADWPRGPSHGAPWPGRHRVHIRYSDAHGADQVRSAWLRDPARYAETVLGGRPERRPRKRSGRRR